MPRERLIPRRQRHALPWVHVLLFVLAGMLLVAAMMARG